MSESFILLGLVAIVGLLGLMTVAIVAITLGLARGSFYGWRRQRVSVNTVQAAALPVDYVTQAQLQDLEKRLATQRIADQANVNSRFSGVNDRLDNLASAVADLRRQLNDDALNAIVLLQRDLRSYRTSCNLRHVVHEVCCRFDLLACAIAIAVVWALIAFIGLLSFGWYAGLLLGACCGIAAGIIAGCVVGHINHRRGVIS